MELTDSSSPSEELNPRNTSTSTQPKRFDQLWMKISVVMRKIFRPVRDIFSNTDRIHWIDDPSVVKNETAFHEAAQQPRTARALMRDCQSRYANALKGSSDEDMQSCFMCLTYTLVHSTEVDDVLRGIDLLNEDLSNDKDNSNKELMPEKMYHLGLGYYRCEQYHKSVELLEGCLEHSPNHTKASNLLKKVEEQIRKDEIMCASCAGVTCFAGFLGTIAASLRSDRKKYEKI